MKISFSTISKNTYLLIILIAVAIIFMSFFQPWAGIHASAVDISRGLSGGLFGIFGLHMAAPVTLVLKGVSEVGSIFPWVKHIGISSIISGYDVPRMVHSGSAKLVITLLHILFKGVKNIEKMSYIVYVFPGLGALLALLGLASLRFRVTLYLMMVLSGLFAGVMLYNLHTIDPSTKLVDIAIGSGLWHTAYGFLIIFIASILWILTDVFGVKLFK